MAHKILLPSERRGAPISVKITGKTLRFRGNIDVEAARLFFEIPSAERTSVKWVDLTDVGSVYARGLLPIAADFVKAGATARLRVVDNRSVDRYLALYGYAPLFAGTPLSNPTSAPQCIKSFLEDGPAIHSYVTESVDEYMSRAIRSDRTGAQSLEWALGELTGNVFHHAESNNGLLVQCLVQPGNQCIFTLVDVGMGIRESLATSYDVPNDRKAIELAIQQGTTSKSGNQGWGLFGSAAIVEAAHGSFLLWSGKSALFIRQDGTREFRDMPFFAGTAIDWRMPTYTKLDLQSVLKIKNEPLTLLWDRYDEEAGVMRFRIADEASSFIDRPTGKRLRTRLLNLARDAITKRCIVDFAGVRMVTSSFADEFLGHFAVLLGEENYKNFVRLDNVDDVVLGVLNGSIQERLRTERQANSAKRSTSRWRFGKRA